MKKMAGTLVETRVFRVIAIVALVGSGLMTRATTASPATVLTNCGTISTSGNYVLGSDITTSGTCFTITTGGVGIDLQGHMLTGNGTGQGFLDQGSNDANIVITNGKITNFGQGIQISDSSSETIDRVNVSGNTAEGIYIGGCCNTLTNIKANNNSNIGIVIVGCCNSLNVIQADSNNGYGLVVQGGSSSGTIIEASGNGEDGVFMSNCCNSVSQAVTKSNGQNGIHENAGHSTVANSSATGNALNGVDFTSVGATGVIPGHNLVTNTIANRNGGDGIGETGSNSGNATGDEVTNSIADLNKGRGIFLICPSNALRDTALSNQGGNLVEVTSSGVCTNVDNIAP
jgi:hypothetical protein